MKTAMERLLLLPEDVRESFIEESKRQAPYRDLNTHTFNSLATMVNSIIWADTRQGNDYWYNIFLNCNKYSIPFYKKYLNKHREYENGK